MNQIVSGSNISGIISLCVAETTGLKIGLSKKAGRAPGFYGVIAVSTLIGMSMSLVGIDPMKAL